MFLTWYRPPRLGARRRDRARIHPVFGGPIVWSPPSTTSPGAPHGAHARLIARQSPMMFARIRPTRARARYSAHVRLGDLGQACGAYEPCHSKAHWCVHGLVWNPNAPCPPATPPPSAPAAPALPVLPTPGTPTAPATTPTSTTPGQISRAEFDAFVSAQLERQQAAENLLAQLQRGGGGWASPEYTGAPGPPTEMPAEEAAAAVVAAPPPSGPNWMLWLLLIGAAGGGFYLYSRRRRRGVGRTRTPSGPRPPAAVAA